ncbi:MAG TPA: BlaI/MecI/CopY family transcriptional regulator [Isosphaeraceae bacterium]|jgi:predicted transcriptional regulator|nr:BlaI/MecI/CopY family transcriptional regulator [Isosphaeraceae bacterium]
MANKAGLTEAEVEVLKVLWDLGPSPIRAINRELEARGRRWAYTTVSTLLLRLATKGCVASDAAGVPHIYRAAVTRDELLGRRLREAADELCDGDAVPLVLALVQRHRFSPEQLARFRRLLDEAKGDVSGSPGE